MKEINVIRGKHCFIEVVPNHLMRVVERREDLLLGWIYVIWEETPS